MSSEPVSELPDLLAHALLDGPYNPSSTLPETFLIDHLVETVQDMEVGEVSYDQARQEFYRHNLGSFDFDSWFAEWVKKDVYM